jgi:hypothetical protein
MVKSDHQNHINTLVVANCQGIPSEIRYKNRARERVRDRVGEREKFLREMNNCLTIVHLCRSRMRGSVCVCACIFACFCARVRVYIRARLRIFVYV